MVAYPRLAEAAVRRMPVRQVLAVARARAAAVALAVLAMPRREAPAQTAQAVPVLEAGAELLTQARPAEAETPEAAERLPPGDEQVTLAEPSRRVATVPMEALDRSAPVVLQPEAAQRMVARAGRQQGRRVHPRAVPARPRAAAGRMPAESCCLGSPSLC